MKNMFQMTIVDRLCTAIPCASLKEVRDMFRQDLEDLLNTRQGRNDIPPWFPELRHSLATYGLNNIDTVDMSSGEELAKILNDIKHAIQQFEPRLENINVVNDSPVQGQDDYVSPFVLRLRIDADLRIGEVVDRVVFNTLIRKGGATVKEETTDA